MVGNKFKRGFTFIELILVLGITGALITAMLVGIGSSVARQRYKDSVYNTSEILQNVFSEVRNTQNDRDGKLQCSFNPDGTVRVSRLTSPEGAGRSQQCLVYGKLVEFKTGTGDYKGTIITTSSVIGKDVYTLNTNGGIAGIGCDLSGGDLEALKCAGLHREMEPVGASSTLAAIPAKETLIAWQPTLHTLNGNTINKNENGAGNTKVTILVVRGPISGAILTFVDIGGDFSSLTYQNEIKAMLTSGNLTRKDACFFVNSPDEFFAGGRRAVKLNPNARNASAVELVDRDVASEAAKCSP